MALSEKAKIVYDYVKAHDGEDFTAADIEAATGLSKKVVDGVVTSAFQKKELMKRTEAEVEVTGDDGKVTHKKVKFITFTDKGREFDPDAPEAPKEDK